MIIGIGIDLVKSARIKKITERFGDRFLNRVFTPAEVAYARKKKYPEQPLSARFAVKEAVLKALGIGVQMGINWQEIETTHDPFGKPVTQLSGQTQKIAQEKLVSKIFTSITHEKDFSIANIILTDNT